MGCFGRVTVKVVRLFLTDMCPPCCSIIFLQLDKPRPVPICFVVKRDSKIIVNVCCKDCNNTNEIKIPLEEVFNDVQKNPLCLLIGIFVCQ